MKRWTVKFDGVDATPIYADTIEAARRGARAAYKRIHADRDPRGRVRVTSPEGEDIEDEVVEAREIVNQLYEGLRLLPGMETPAEKLRSVVVLLEAAQARKGEGAIKSKDVSRGGGGDTELQEALEPILTSEVVPAAVRAQIQDLSEWVGLNTPDKERRKIELKLFRALWESGLADSNFAEVASCELHKASAYLVKRLRAAEQLAIHRFEGADDVDAYRDALRPHGKGAANLSWAFVSERDGPDPVSTLQPLVLLRDRLLQPAALKRGVQHGDAEVIALDNALFDTLDSLMSWEEGLGRVAETILDEKGRSLLPRAVKRIKSTRQRMADAAKAGETVLPAETARRDLIKFLIDQVHRIADALALLPDRGLRDAFDELVFKDVVYRGAGAYLSQHFQINIDMDVVEGADTEGLVGRFKDEPGGPKPRSRTTRIYSVVVPCYTQEGVAIRPASVRQGRFQ